MTDYELLSAAFPAADGAAVGTCAFCGAPRQRHHALCPHCWAAVPAAQRREYLSLDLTDRARWILAARERAS